MKTVSAALKAHLEGTLLTVCTLWKVTRVDGAIFGFTDHDQDVVFSGVTYRASTGHTQSSIRTTAQLSVDNLEVQSMLSGSTITEADIQAGLWDFAAILIQIVNYNDLTMGSMIQRQGWLGNIKTGRFNFIAELRGMTQPLQQQIGRIFTPGCDAALGDTRCTVNLASFTVTGNVTSVSGTHTFNDTARTENAGYFDGGLVTWITGSNAGYRMEVKIFANASVTLQQPMLNTITIGDTYSMHAGCDKTRATCVSRFTNVVNFRGFPDLPGRDAMVAGKL